MVLVLIPVVALVGVFYFISIRNSLISLSEEVDQAWANIDVILKQRFDEIKSLVQVVEQYTQYENSILQKLAQARNSYSVASSIEEKVTLANEMGAAIKGVFALAENYPDLKANTNFMQLQTRISAIEETLADRRENFNDGVTSYNTRIQQFPDLIVANYMKFVRKPLFRINEEEKNIPSLKMNIGA